MRRLLLLSLVVAASCRSSEDTNTPNDAGGTESGVESCYEPPVDGPSAVVAATAPLSRYVDPFIGTGGVGFGIGSTFPGPQVPYGMARPGPDTMGAGGAPTFSHCVGYSYDDNYVYGFSQTRLHGIGIVDAGAIALFPTRKGMTDAKTTAKGRRVTFNHKNEKASPGYYQVKLDDETNVELTATERVAYHRYTFPAEVDATVLVDIGHALPSVKIVDGSVTIDEAKQEISGFAHYDGGYSGRFGGVPVYFVAKVSRAFEKYGVWKTGALETSGTTKTGGDTGAWFSFDATTDNKVTVAVALSFVDVEHARKNLDAEAKVLDFDAARTSAEGKWEQALSRVQLEARSARDLEIAYTSLYHVLLMPTLAMDVDGSYRGLDKMVHVADGFTYYTDFSLWDTYRTLHPFLNLVYPEYQRDFLRSMATMAKENAAPPKWPLGIGETGGMVGDSAAVVFGDAYAKGIRDFDVKGTYDVLRASAMGPLAHDGRDNIKDYVDRGYVPIDLGNSGGSKTLEYAYDDFALAVLAEGLGEKADAEMFRKRAGNWKNIYDAQDGFLLGKKSDGSFPRDDDKTAWQDYWAEGTTWNYTWFVPQDMKGLADAMGGRDKFFTRLDDFFAMSTCQLKTRLAPKPYYWHSNEPVLFIPWAYAELDDAKKSARWVRWALASEYGDGPDGVPGNDDGGTMAAWYLFSSLGVFPRVAFTDYLLGSPIFPKATIKVAGGNLVIVAKDTSATKFVPTSVTWNGKQLERPRIEHSELIKGGTIEFTLTGE